MSCLQDFSFLNINLTVRMMYILFLENPTFWSSVSLSGRVGNLAGRVGSDRVIEIESGHLCVQLGLHLWSIGQSNDCGEWTRFRCFHSDGNCARRVRETYHCVGSVVYITHWQHVNSRRLNRQIDTHSTDESIDRLLLLLTAWMSLSCHVVMLR